LGAVYQQKNAGALCGVLMSLLIDQNLLLHPEQIRRINKGLSACTVGSLREKIVIEQHLEFIRSLLETEDPKKSLQMYIDNVDFNFVYRNSTKHMVGREISFDAHTDKKFA
jgi:hypothetical protein